ncbi:MAG: gliding motility-associated C-terminal domain-containing protein [Bacteroidales bacterium]|nr:gliding motility-associated C-terminal domain-containing protein [Bacteroidales bacterium]
MKKLFFVMLLFLAGFYAANAQYTVTGATGTTISPGTGSTIYLGSYSPGSTYEVTICSSDPLCSHVTLTFDAWTVGSGNFCVYNGNTTSAPLIGCNAWGTTQSVSANIANTSGCLTIQFSASSTGSNIGGVIGCQFMCQSVLASVVSTDPPYTMEGGVRYLDICQGDEISMQSAGVYQNTTYTQSDGTSTFLWTLGDGTTYTTQNFTHTFPSDEGYSVSLLITDVEGCTSTNEIGYRVRVSRQPIFAGTHPTPTVICQGDPVTLTGNVSSTEYISLVEPIISGTTYLPDGSGVSYTTSIFFDYFTPGQILEDVEDLCGICMNIEHSYLGDLVMEITCPYNTITGSATTVVLEHQHGGGTYLGEPIDDSGGGGPGIGYDYCFNTPAQADYLSPMGTIASGYSTLPSGSYVTSEPLDALVGCELNGNWTITITDNWSIDDGYIFAWWMCFDPSIMPDNWSYGNTYPTTMWSAGATGGSMSSATVGTYTGTGLTDTWQPFVYTVVDDFGCSYDTTIMVNVLASDATECCVDPVVNIITPAQTICGNEITLDAGDFHMPGNEGTWTHAGGIATITYSEGTSPVTDVTVDGYGTFTFTWTEVNNGSAACTSSDNVTITFLEEPSVYAGLDDEQCGNVYLLDAGTLPGGTTGTWSSVPALGAGSYGNISSPTTTVTIPGFSGTMPYEFTWTADNGVCSNSDDVKIIFYETPAPNAGANSTVCGSIFDLNATGVVGEGFWTVETTGGVPVYDVIFSDPSDPTNPYPEREPDAQANIALVATATTLVFTWSETNGMCTGNDDVQVTFTAGPYAYAGNDNFICGDSLQLYADTVGVGTLNGFWTDEYGVNYWDNETGTSLGLANDPHAYVSIPASLDDLYVDGIATLDFVWNMDNGGCISSDVVTMTFYQQPEAMAGRDTFVCGQTFTFQAVQSVDTSIGTWLKLSGPGTPIYTSTVFPSIPTRDPNATVLVTEYGDYQFQWTEQNPNFSSCNTNDVINVKFVEVPTELDAGNDTAFCQTPDDQYIAYLNATGGFGTGVWHSTVYLTGYNYESQMNPSTQVISNHPGTETFCWRETVESGFSQPCVVEKCVDITFEPTPNVTLLSGDDWVCGPQYITINGHVIDADTAYWFDASHAGTQFINNTTTNPINVNDTVQVGIYGHHQIYLIAANYVQIGSYTAACRDTAEVLNITFYEWPEPYVRATDTACGTCYNLVGTPSMDSTAVTWSALSPSGITFSSTGTIIGTSAIDTVCVAITDTTRFINFTEYYPYQNRCGVSTQIAVKFARIPYGLYDFTAPNCFGAEWVISAREDSLPTYEWSFGESGEYFIDSVILNAETGEYENIVHWVDGDTMHIVDVVLTSSYGCNSPIFRDTLYEPPINYAAQNLEHETCSNSNGWVIIQGEGGLSPEAFHGLNWANDSVGDVTIYEDSIYVQNLPAGTYWVEVSDIYNCKVMDTIQILNTGLIDAIIDTLQFTLIDDGIHNGVIGDATAEIPLISLTDNARFYRWYIYTDEDSLVFGPFTGQIQSYEFLLGGDYKVILEVESREGCIDRTTYMYLKILGESYVEIPNIFTPNGDGTNDVYQVHARALKSFEGTIVNRWGKTLYEWTDWQSPNAGWDGTINGGNTFASPGVYYYIIKATGIDNDKAYEFKGALHLIREK